MRLALRSSKPWKMLIAAVAICVTAVQSQAALTLSVTFNSAPVFSSAGFTLNGADTAGSTGVFGGGYTLAYIVNSSYNATTQTETVRLTGTLTYAGTAPAPGLIGFNLAGTVIPLPVGPNGILSSTLSGVFNGSGNSGTGFANSISNSATLDPDGVGAAPSVTTPGNPSFTASGTNTAFSGSSTSVLIPVLSANYDMSTNAGTIIANGPGTNISFVSTATVALPEPTGVIAAMAGLPCMGALLGLVRRRLGRGGNVEPEAALAV